jgi:hypothetical protein
MADEDPAQNLSENVTRADRETWATVAALSQGDVTIIEGVDEILELVNDLDDGRLVVAALLGHTSQLLSRLAEVVGESVPEAVQRYAEYYQFIDVIKDMDPEEW